MNQHHRVNPLTLQPGEAVDLARLLKLDILPEYERNALYIVAQAMECNCGEPSCPKGLMQPPERDNNKLLRAALGELARKGYIELVWPEKVWRRKVNA